MSNPSDEKTINAQILRRYVADGLTLDEMSKRFFEETGVRRARSSFSAAMTRYGIKSAHPRARYRDTLPWRVKKEHLMAYEPRMLRLLGRRQAGLPLKADETQRLDAFLRELNDENKVIVYNPKTAKGFHYTERQDGDDDYIRRPPEVQV